MRVVTLVSVLLVVNSLNAFTGGTIGVSGIGMSVVAVVWAATLDLSEMYRG